MKLSIVTINYNNAEGLRKTMESVLAQTYTEIEYIIVDGASTDGSVDVICELATRPTIKWVSEKDTGIYNAMNKGIEIALGKRVVNDDHSSSPIANSPSPIADTEYIQILNSGDLLASEDVTYKMVCQLNQYDESVGILYGNMIKVNAVGKVVGKSGYTEYSLRQFYRSTLNHDCAYIRKDLFEEYGLYDESLKIVSDWKWYLQAIGLGRVKPEYVDIDVTIFDDGGISETNLTLRNAERRKVLEEVLPPAVLWDYDTHAFEMEQMKRLRRWHLYGLVYFMERVCFKFEKWFCRR